MVALFFWLKLSILEEASSLMYGFSHTSWLPIHWKSKSSCQTCQSSTEVVRLAVWERWYDPVQIFNCRYAPLPFTKRVPTSKYLQLSLHHTTWMHTKARSSPEPLKTCMAWTDLMGWFMPFSNFENSGGFEVKVGTGFHSLNGKSSVNQPTFPVAQAPWVLLLGSRTRKSGKKNGLNLWTGS